MKMNRRKKFPGDERVCAECSHFLGMGDWNLCCDISHPTQKEKEDGKLFEMGHLCYKNTEACDAFEERRDG